jgi:hypothetical protein
LRWIEAHTQLAFGRRIAFLSFGVASGADSFARATRRPHFTNSPSRQECSFETTLLPPTCTRKMWNETSAASGALSHARLVTLRYVDEGARRRPNKALFNSQVTTDTANTSDTFDVARIFVVSFPRKFHSIRRLHTNEEHSDVWHAPCLCPRWENKAAEWRFQVRTGLR